MLNRESSDFEDPLTQALARHVDGFRALRTALDRSENPEHR
jgi:hypothetical protein